MLCCSSRGWVLPVEMPSSGGGFGRAGRAGAPRPFPSHSGSAVDVTPVSPVSYVAGVAFSRVSSPIWWLSCVIFCVLAVLFRDFSPPVPVSCERAGRTRRWRKGRARRAASASLAAPRPWVYFGDPEALQAYVLPSCSPRLCSLARVAGNDLIVLAKPQFAL